MRLLEYLFFSPRPPIGYLPSIILTTIPYVLLPLLIYTIVRICYLRTLKKAVIVKRELLYAFTVAYIGFVLKLTIVPEWSFHRDINTQELIFYSGIGPHLPINLVPFRNVFSFLLGNVDVNQNDIFMIASLNLAGGILILSPIGYLLPSMFPRVNSWRVVISVGIGCALIIETIQFFIGRVADIDDILLSVVGISGGYWIYCTTKRNTGIDIDHI